MYIIIILIQFIPGGPPATDPAAALQGRQEVVRHSPRQPARQNHRLEYLNQIHILVIFYESITNQECVIKNPEL